MSRLYYLGVDVGTTRVAAATAMLAHDGSVMATHVPLGRRHHNVPAVAFVTTEGDLVFGEDAERRGLAEPGRLVREFRRSVGDDVPLLVAGHQIVAAQLFARAVASVIDTVSERENARPAGVTVTHPSAWGPHRVGVVRSALASLGVGEVELMSEPLAAARNHEATRPLVNGQSVAVYDLGGSTFGFAMLRREEDGTFTILGEPAGADNLGGANFDDAVFRHVLTSSGLDDSNPADEDARIELTRLRRECVDAKEALSFDSDVAVPVVVSAGRTSVRLTRSEFEAMIEPGLDRTIDILEEALDRAGVVMTDVESILLVGGSSRIPRVAQRLSELFDRPIAIDSDPKSSIALGAARASLARLSKPASATAPVLSDTSSESPLALAGHGSASRPVFAEVSSPVQSWRHAAFSLAGLVLVGGLMVGGAWSGFSLNGFLLGIDDGAGTAVAVHSPVAAPGDDTTSWDSTESAPDAGPRRGEPDTAGPEPKKAAPATAPVSLLEAVAYRQPPPNGTTNVPGTASSQSSSGMPQQAASTTSNPSPIGTTTATSSARTNTATQSTPTGSPTGTPSLTPSPTPSPTPTPAPVPEPTPDPTPVPEPTPDSTPPPAPEPTPDPTPTPEPTTEPAPEPTPEPTPEQAPEPTPDQTAP